MSKYPDYTGEVIGELTCVKKLNEKNKDGVYKYQYKCSCGNDRVATRAVLTRRLREGGKVSCGCLNQLRTKDITGKRSHLLTAIKPTGEKYQGQSCWECLCDCGNTVTLTIGIFNYGATKSCGCMRGISARNRECSHGLTQTKAYRTWSGIKSRCFNENDKSFKYYGGNGLLLEDKFIHDFLAFYNEVGDPPDDGLRYTIDRIDNTKGYVTGNMRWATNYQQARNKGVQSNNKTGTKGVYVEVKKYTLEDGTITETLYAASVYYNLEGERITTRFSFKEYGEELALFLAQEYRTTMMERLNLLGAGYTHYHIYGELEND